MDKEILENENLEYVMEYTGAYDGWMSYKLKSENFKRHRINKDKIISEDDYGNVNFITENGDKFINLRKIDE